MALRKEIEAIQELLSGAIEKRVFLTIHQQMTERIFAKGLNSKNQRIGDYSKGYIKRRQKKGLGTSKKVILEFTGQMRNDFVLLEQGNNLGSGFTNNKNGEKSFWVEATYDKEIFKLSQNEEDLIEELFDDEIDRIIGKRN